MKFYNCILKSILIHFHLKSDLYKLLKKNITLFAKEFLIKKKKFKSPISKNYF